MTAARALERRRPDRLFDDPLAAAFAGREGLELYIVVRTPFFDDFLLSSCRSIGARQSVLLAVGMGARAFRINWASQTRLYELDRREVLVTKETVLTRAVRRSLARSWTMTSCPERRENRSLASGS